jgi:hypothetical protein
MTYLELLDALHELSEDQLEDTVTIHLLDQDEFFAVTDCNCAIGDDILHDNHFFLEIQA